MSSREELAAIRSALEDDDAELRRRGVIQLEESGLAESAELALVALGDEDWRVRKEAVRVATALARRLPLAQDLVAAITQGENVGLRNAALEVLGLLGDDVSDVLVEALSRAPVHSKKFLVAALSTSHSDAATRALVEASRAEDANVAAEALEALSRRGGTVAEDALRAQLRSESPYQRMAALDGLDRIGAVVPWEDLSPLLSDSLVRRVALRSLGRCANPMAVGPLLTALSEPSSHVISIAAVALDELHGATATTAEAVQEQISEIPEAMRAALRPLIREGDRRTRQAVVLLLLLARDGSALEGAVTLAADEELPNRAAQALADWGVAAAEPLLALVERESGLRRAYALELAADLAAAARHQGEEVSDEIIEQVRAVARKAVDGNDGAVALAAARTMAYWAEDSDAQRLASLAQRGSESVSQTAAEALVSLSRQSQYPVAEAVADVSLSGPGGAALTSVVARLPAADRTERLQAALTADDPETRKAAIRGLASDGGVREAEHIALALADEDVDVQMAAAAALGTMRDADGRTLGAEQLLLSLSSDSPAVVAAAARALGRAGEGRAIQPLRDLLRTADSGVSVAAMEGLRALSDPTLGEVLVEALGHQDEEVVKQALHALRESGGPRHAARIALGLSHHAWDVRRLSAGLLGEIGGDTARDALLGRIETEEDDLVRAAIDEALASLREQED